MNYFNNIGSKKIDKIMLYLHAILVSSEPSPQWSKPSQTFVLNTQLLLSHRYFPGGQATNAHIVRFSSLPSTQSNSPSHLFPSDMQSPLLHTNWLLRLSVHPFPILSKQFHSSEPSGQSTSPSHFHLLE